ncbi:DHS-like NAD/FAD-binding domain-containing protein [Calycina marina]|uniref:DHS-like NAD/FAD-binding domain-containing protein n=1 Tax=Calycina marina TaxID=1763456 RepID=A0A9P7YYG0_9HELO|nr:DHS-like NAD/FAD-binding domain-containing protein [Calycina marina]
MTQRVKVASLPDCVAYVQLCPLIKALRDKKKIVIIAGAGISAAAGIPIFDAMPMASTTIFNMSMYNNENDTKILNEIFSDMCHRVQSANPTQFHHVLEAITEEGRLHRLYFQNINGLDTQLAPLKTQIPLPPKGPSHFDPALFASESSLPSCTECKVHKLTGKAPVLRPRVWLYLDDDYPDANAIGSVADADLQKKFDLVVVVASALKVESAKKLMKDVCTAVRRGGGIAVLINLKAPTRDLDFFDLVIE